MDETKLDKRAAELYEGNANLGKLHSIRGELKQVNSLLTGKPAKEHHRKKAKRDPKRRSKS